jgi:electron transport complex protein RnfD
MFNVSLWPHIRTRFDWRQLNFRGFLALLPMVGFGVYLWGRELVWAILLSWFLGFIWHIYALKKEYQKSTDFGFVNDALLINLLMPTGINVIVPACLTVLNSILRSFVRDREYAFPFNFPLILSLTLWLLQGKLALGIDPIPVVGAGTLFRGNAYFISGWLPAGLTILFSVLFINRLYKWRIFLSGILMLMAFILLSNFIRGGVHIPSALMLLNLFLFSLGVLCTDHASGPAKNWGQYWYGMLCGSLLFIFFLKGLHMEGVFFAPLIAGLLNPLLDKIGGMKMSLSGTFNAFRDTEN